MSAIMLFYFRCYNTLIIFGGHISTALSLVHSSCSAVAVRKAKGCGSSLCSTGAFNTYVLSGVKYQFKSVTFSSFFLKIEDYILRRNIQCEISRWTWRFTNLWHIQTESSDLIEALSMTIWMVSLHYVLVGVSFETLRPDLKVDACLLHMKHSSSTISKWNRSAMTVYQPLT